MSEKNRLGIKSWAQEDRPREKMMQKGIQTLSDAELLAILIGSGNRDETAVELARRILKESDNDLNKLGRSSIAELTSKFKGIGEAKAITIASAMELGRRRKATDSPKKPQIMCSAHIYDIFHPLLSDLLHEEFWVLLLNRSNTVIHKALISQGGVSATVVDVKIILKIALEKLAAGLAVCHNHPSGSLIPSISDIETTKRIKNACEMVEIMFLDHIIISGNQYYSFADEDAI